jgi:DNA modification methylase
VDRFYRGHAGAVLPCHAGDVRSTATDRRVVVHIYLHVLSVRPVGDVVSLRDYLFHEEPGIALYCGDCREVLPLLDKEPFAVVTDPPYGVSYSSNYGASWEGTLVAGDDSTDLRDWIVRWASGAPMLVFGSWKAPRPAGVRQVLIFDKGPAFGMGDLSFPWKNSHEEIYVLGDGFCGSRDESVLYGHRQVSWESKGRCHPNQKPLTLIRYLVSRTQAPMVIDPCMGSGTTVEAAKIEGRRAIGIEIEPKYCEIAVKRLRQEVLPL